jgi:hypothetical protein
MVTSECLPDDSENLTPNGGRSVLELGLTARQAWEAEELRVLLAYHLEAPLNFDLRGLEPPHARGLRGAAEAGCRRHWEPEISRGTRPWMRTGRGTHAPIR